MARDPRKNLHKSLFIRFKIEKVKYFSKFWVPFLVALIVSGIVCCVLSAVMVGRTHNNAWIAGIVIGWSFGFFSFFPIILVQFFKVQIEILEDIVVAVRSNEIVYLHDRCFAGLTQPHRVKLCQRLIASKNLDRYELLGNIALVKKTLHLSPARVAEFQQHKTVGNLSRIDASRLVILEPDILIKSEALIAEEQKTEDFFIDGHLKRKHLDKLLTANPQTVSMRTRFLGRLGAGCFLVGFVTVFVGFIFLATMGVKMLPIALSGFAVAFLVAVFQPYASYIDGRAAYFHEIVIHIKSKDITGIDDNCFKGLSRYQRIYIVDKLIECGKLDKYERIGEIAVAKEARKYTLKSAAAALKKPMPTDANKRVVNIKVNAVTNCAACGAAVAEHLNFCTYCGAKIVREVVKETAPAQKPRSNKKRK